LKMLAYGEDALTLWDVTKRLSFILQKLNKPSPLSDCRVIFRPSFGRSGGEKSAQFGEFDFIILSKVSLYLGESKWDRSSEKIRNGHLSLRAEQLLRHRLFKFYVKQWFSNKPESWQVFVENASNRFKEMDIPKPIAPVKSLLATNLQMILNIIHEHYSSNIPQIKDVLLYFHTDANLNLIPKTAGNGIEMFEVIGVNYSEISVDKFIEFELETENKPID
jgi:hypothetical protein